MPTNMLMEFHCSLTWTAFLTSVPLASASSKPKMLLAATPLGQMSNPTKVSPLTSHSQAHVPRTLSIDSPLGPKSRRSLVTKFSKGKSYAILRTPLSEIPMLVTLEKLLSHGVLNTKIMSKKIAMNVRWNRLHMATCLVLTLTNTGTTITLALTVKNLGFLSLTTSPE